MSGFDAAFDPGGDYGNYGDTGPDNNYDPTGGMQNPGQGTFTNTLTPDQISALMPMLGMTGVTPDMLSQMSPNDLSAALGLGSSDGGVNLSSISKLFSGLGGGGGKNPFSLTNGDGSLNWSSLIPLLASVFGGATAYNATKKGSSDMVNALNSANSQITSLLGPGGAMGNYAPYQTIGQMATGKLGNYQYKPLAPQFKSAVKGT
jgi:hypothetical protein